MIRVVLDTNIVISGSLWFGKPAQILQAIEDKEIDAVTSEEMLDELKEVIERPKFAKRLELVGKSVDEIVQEYVSRVKVIEAHPLKESVSKDQDDDMFIACAISGNAQLIVSGDPHLLDVKSYQDIVIITAAELLERISPKQDKE